MSNETPRGPFREAPSAPRPELGLYVGGLYPVEPIRGWPEGLKATSLTSSQPVEKVEALLEAAFASRDDWDRQTWRRVSRAYWKDRRSLRSASRLVWEGAEVVGVCLLSASPGGRGEPAVPYVDVIAVAPGWQRRGLGAALLEGALEALRQEGFRGWVQAHVRSDNLASIRLFERAGFLLWPEARERPG